MRLNYATIKPFLKRGAVLRDAKFVFPDDIIDEKWILLLSDEIEDGHIFCLTTSQKGTYKNSFAPHFVCNNGKVFNVIPSIIETQRIDIMPAEALEKKYNEGHIEYKGCLSQDEIEAIATLIYEDDTISEIYKEIICLEFYN